jgi:hypothetical protein
MNTFVIEHVTLNELPAAWRAKLNVRFNNRVTVRIEEEDVSTPQTNAVARQANNPLFGMWRDREDTRDVISFARGLRDSRFNVDGSRREG